MKVAIMQPYFFPYIGYFQMIAAVDKFILYDLVSYRKASWMNRNRLFDISKKEVFYFRAPIRKFSLGTKIRDIELQDVEDWRKKILREVYYNYKRSRFFDEIFPRLEKVIRFETNSLHKFNTNAISNIAEWVGITTEISFQNESYLQIEQELLIDYSERPEEIKNKRIIRICESENSTHYVNAIGGMELYDKSYFEQYGINLSFIKTDEIKYDQVGEEFIPNLSVLDVLFHNGLIKTGELIKNYRLI
ncbi:WbqC family protein [Roseivirga sp.]|uniref:WbqC family protein n=1 Tax=Roseivirga sp. TaxID=1964215 RepID=UPI003B8E033F